MSVPETLDVAEAAALLRAEAETIMQLARKGELPGTRIGKSWVFLREDVLSFLKHQITKDTAERRRQRISVTPVAVCISPPANSRRTELPILPTLPKHLPKATHHR